MMNMLRLVRFVLVDAEHINQIYDQEQVSFEWKAQATSYKEKCFVGRTVE